MYLSQNIRWSKNKTFRFPFSPNFSLSSLLQFRSDWASLPFIPSLILRFPCSLDLIEHQILSFHDRTILESIELIFRTTAISSCTTDSVLGLPFPTTAISNGTHQGLGTQLMVDFPKKFWVFCYYKMNLMLLWLKVASFCCDSKKR